MSEENQLIPHGNGIDELVIDPAAEPHSAKQQGDVSGQQEVYFYKLSGTEFDLLHNQQNLGFLGKLFGSNSTAPTNIAGFVISCSFVALLISLFVPSNAELVESRKWLIGLITSTMSFIFGAASNKK